MYFKQGYRLATPEERILINEHGTCWLVKEMEGRARACPNPRREGSSVCEHHAKFDEDYEPPTKPDIADAVDIRNMIKPLPGDGEEKLAEAWDKAYKEAYADVGNQRVP